MVQQMTSQSNPVAARMIAGAGSPGASTLAIGFGMTAAMWTVAYFCWLPRIGWGVAAVPAWLLAAGLAACIVGGGYVAGRYGPRGVMGGVRAGLLSGVLNLMVLGSLLGGEQPGEVMRNAAWWVPAWLAFSAALAAIGAAAGVRLGPDKQTRRGADKEPRRSAATREALEASGRVEEVNWTGLFSKVAVATVLLLVLVGGMVTSEEAGLAVVDWPNSFGKFMFLLPLSRMTGGAYYEHSHRLIGSLVGLTTLVLAAHLWRTDPRPRVRWLIAGALLAVIVQGILGGLRVTGYFTLTTDPTQVSPKTWLAIVHGIFGQVVFGLLTAVAVLTSTSWHNSVTADDSPRRRTDAVLTAVLVGLLVVQLTLGALVRHLITPPMQMHEAAARLALVHVALAVVVVGWAVLAGARAWGLYGERFAVLRQFGLGMVWLAGLQVLLGFLSLVVTRVFMEARDWPEPSRAEVSITTLHQTVGAVMLAWAVGLALWVRRAVAADRADG